MIFSTIFLIFTLLNQAFSTGIPIWELLTHEEKIGNLTFIFLRLVHLYCKKSNIPDCEKVLTLYGISNLLKVDERTLDLLDPNHKDARSDLWSKVMSGAFDLPQEETSEHRNLIRDSHSEWERDFNVISNIDSEYYFPSHDYDVDYNERFPHAVRVPAPPHFKPPKIEDTKSDKSKNGLYEDSGKKTSIGKNVHKQLSNLGNDKESKHIEQEKQHLNNEQHKEIETREQQIQKLDTRQDQGQHLLHPSTAKEPVQSSRFISTIPQIASASSSSKADNSQFEKKNISAHLPHFEPRNLELSQPKREDYSKTFYIEPSDDNREPILFTILRK